MHQIKKTMMMLVTIHAVLTMEAAASPLMCRAEDHVYYNEQLGGCLSCEPCNPGEEQMDIQKWAASIPSSIFTIYGPTQCPTCITCREGYFNSERAFQCTRCKNCTLHNKHEVEQCSSISDAECDGVLIDKRSNVNAKFEESTSSANEAETHTWPILAIIGLTLSVLTMGFLVTRKLYKRCPKIRGNAVLQAEESSTTPLMQERRSSIGKRKRHNSEPSYSNSTDSVKTLQRNFSDPGERCIIDIEIDSPKEFVSEDEQIDKEFLISLSQMLCERSLFIPFARRLGLSDVKIDTLKHDYGRDGLDEVSYQILATLQKNESLTYKGEAIQTLQEMSLSHIIQQLCRCKD